MPKTLYPKPLLLEVESLAEVHRFLETETTVSGTIRVKHSNHNSTAMWRGEAPKRLSRVDPCSNRTENEFITGLYGELHRIDGNCSDDVARMQAACELRVELDGFNWPRRWLLAAMQMHLHKKTHTVWQNIYDLLNDDLLSKA
jgi:hypothetical protein